MANELDNFNPEDLTEDGINELAEEMLEELETLLEKYRPVFGNNRYFGLLQTDYYGIKGMFELQGRI